MKTTGVFEKHVVDIDVETLTEPIVIVPFGDVHFDSPNHAKNEFDRFCEESKLQTNAYYLGMGDFIDFPSTSERRSILAGHFHDTSIENFELMWERLSMEFVKKTEFMQGRLLGLMEGNHYGVLANGTTTTQMMIPHYNYKTENGKKVAVGGVMAKYLGVECLIRLRLNYKSAKTAVDIYAHHGRGQGRTRSGSIAPVEQMARNADANIYIMGHNHDLGTWPDRRLKLVSTKAGLDVRDRPIRYVRSGSFLLSRVPGRPNYAVDRNYPPLALGVAAVEVRLKYKYDGKGGRRFEFKLKGTA